MSVTTGTGDRGQTDLWSGERVSKDDPRVEAYGTVDELNSWLGLCRQEAVDDKASKLLEKMQKDLFRVAGQLATAGKKYDYPLTPDDADFLKNEIRELESDLGLRSFVLPGQTKTSAHLDIARTIARRAERRTLSVLASTSDSWLSDCLVYLNRVSDLLYILARREEKSQGQIQAFKY
jgi:ATP:cob(I)alamin adenosyltransferase